MGLLRLEKKTMKDPISVFNYQKGTMEKMKMDLF